MSALVGLGPLLDPSALATIARQLWAARDRLNLRMRGNIPSAPELYLAFHAHMTECDRLRLQQAQSRPDSYAQLAALPPPPATESPPDVVELMRYLSLADAAYARTLEAQSLVLEQLGVEEALECRLMAEKWCPGYFICFDKEREHLILSIRGSKEMSDFITNLSADMEPFLSEYGHQGVVRSAQRLFHQLLPVLMQFSDIFKPNAFVVVGHSLGGAVASAFTMLLRQTAHDDRSIKRPLRYPTCYAFAPPPCLSERLAEHSESCDITTVVTHLDLVPRLSAASVDRLLIKLSRFDWGRNLSSSVGRAVESVASTFMRPETARGISQTVASTGTATMALASAGIRYQARSALEAPRSRQPSSLWNMALNATIMMTSMLNQSLEGNRQRRRTEDVNGNYAFAREFGMSERDVHEELGDQPTDVFLAGKVWHLDRAFSDAAERGEDGEGIAPSVLVRRERGFFRDVELSQWMVHDHNPRTTMAALRHLEERT
ncbi:unnamed protein product [Agarophyton chilense]|eukprot:gb/GEZJ01000942.1/.p1 GENE.gb/GEZJ01000942.1/~~gb/GEZJ01000942.1/.p1  ORF type:complete len:497 (-),score=54.11 gb/GEZJ01000942.1/:106-1575(-)